MTLNLNEEKWMNFLKAVSNFRLPKLNYFNLNYVPEDSEDVRKFLKSSPLQSDILFNNSKVVQLEASKYMDALKAAAKNAVNHFGVYNINLSCDQFWELVSVAKGVKTLYFTCSLIASDSTVDFGSDMEGCVIEKIYFQHSGNSTYSNWKSNPMRFENIIAGIAKCVPLAKSLKALDLYNSDISKTDAQNVLTKYGLNEVKLENVN